MFSSCSAFVSLPSVDVDGECVPRRFVVSLSLPKKPFLGVFDGGSVWVVSFSTRFFGVAAGFAKSEHAIFGVGIKTGVRSTGLPFRSCWICSWRSSMTPRNVGTAKSASDGTSFRAGESCLCSLPALMKGENVVHEDPRGGVGGSELLLGLRAG